jgi:4'-phosphopantetheinyl transferase
MKDLIALDPDEVHVWRASLAQPELLARFAGALSADERERAARFRYEVHRARFVASRAIQRHVLSRYTGIATDQLAFAYSAYGKPSLAGAASSSGLSFNISNSGDLAVYAVCRGRKVGVDVEEIRPLHSAASIAERFFSPSEIETLAALPPAERERAFFRCWARKEAYVKALGGSVWSQLDSFDVSVAPDEPARLLGTRPDPQEAARWEMRALDVGPQYIGALVVQAGGPLGLRCFEWLAPHD